MMRADVWDAVESARSVDVGALNFHAAEPQRRRSFGSVRAVVLAVAQELPSEMTLAELIDELSISNAHREDRQ
jgi:hypothetical protein